MKYKTIYADPPWMEHGAGRIPRARTGITR